MNDWKCRVEIEPMKEEDVELRLFDSPDSRKYLSWEMLLSEAQDLACWWETEEFSSETRRLPLRDVRYRSIQVSMYSSTLVQIKGFDTHGSPKIVGWTLPAPVVEALVHYFAVREAPDRPSNTTSDYEEGLEPCNSIEAAVQRQSPTTDRIAVYFFRSGPQKRTQITTQDVTSTSENRKEDIYHVAR